MTTARLPAAPVSALRHCAQRPITGSGGQAPAEETSDTQMNLKISNLALKMGKGSNAVNWKEIDRKPIILLN